MKFRAPLLLLLSSAVVGPMHLDLRAQNQTDAKIRLMGEALTARDAGDFPRARSKLEALNEIAPNDPGIRRLLSEIAKKEDDQRRGLETSQSSPAPIVLPEPAIEPETGAATPEVKPRAPQPSLTGAATGNNLTTLPRPPLPTPISTTDAGTRPNRVETSERLAGISVIEERPPGPTPAPDHFAEAVAKVEKEGVAFAQGGGNQDEKLMTYVQAQRMLALAYAKKGDYAEATTTLDEALTSLQSSVDELRAERRSYIRKQVETEEAKKRRATQTTSLTAAIQGRSASRLLVDLVQRVIPMLHPP